jgi:hypothetical protein
MGLVAVQEPDPTPAVPPTIVPSATADDRSESPVAITTRIAPDPSNVGDLLTLEVSAAYPRGGSVNLPTTLKLDPLYVVSTEVSAPESTGAGLRKSFSITFQHFAVGQAAVPPFDLTYVSESGEVQTIAVPSRTFTVESLLANEVDPQRRPEDPPISITYPNELAENVVYSVLATTVLGLLGWLIWTRWRRRQKPVYSPPPVPPHETALKGLQRLEDSDWLARQEFQLYYLQLTEIAKAYLQGRFEVEALDRTTEEIRVSLLRNQDRIAPLSSTEVVRLLNHCDLVKFARFTPTEQEARSSLAVVREMVERTMPRPEEERSAKPPHGTKTAAGSREAGDHDAQASPSAPRSTSPENPR